MTAASETVSVTPSVHVAFARADADERVAARALLRSLLAEVAPEAAGLPLGSASGRPFLVGCADLDVSLSHDGGWVAAAVGARIGVDVQVPVAVSESMVNRCCGPEDRLKLAALPPAERDREFAWLWTVQEACVKAEGTGLAGSPWSVPVRVGAVAGQWREFRWLSLREVADVPVSCAYLETT